MATRNISAALDAAHTPEARAKAVRTILHMTKLRTKLATKYNVSSSYFSKGRMLETVKRLNIPLKAIPVELFHPFPITQRKVLLEKRRLEGTNGGGSSIPLHAIPERKPKTNGERAPWGSKGQSKKGHPNAELIGKVLDTLRNHKTTDKVAERLLSALDKLVG